MGSNLLLKSYKSQLNSQFHCDLIYSSKVRPPKKSDIQEHVWIASYAFSACFHITCGHLHAKCEAPARFVMKSNEVTQDYSRQMNNHIRIENKTKKQPCPKYQEIESVKEN